MYIDLVINNKAKQMYFGYISGVDTSNAPDKSTLNRAKTPRIEKLGTSFRQLLGSERPNKILFAQDGNTFMQLNNLPLDINFYDNCDTVADDFYDTNHKPLARPIVAGTLYNGEIITEKQSERYSHNTIPQLSLCMRTKTIYPSYTDYRLDFMFMATDEIINGKRTIAILYANKFKFERPVLTYGRYKKNGTKVTPTPFINFNISPLQIGFQDDPPIIELEPQSRINNKIYPMFAGTNTELTLTHSYKTCDAAGCILAYYDYSGLGEQKDYNKTFTTPVFAALNGNPNFYDFRGYFNPTNFPREYISDPDIIYPPTPDIPDLPLPDPDNPTDPDNPDNPDNLEPDPSDPIPPPKPSPSPTFGAKLITAYRLNQDNLNALADEMWTSNFYDNIVKMFVNPMDCLISLSEYPINVPAGAQQAIQLGNVEMSTAASVVRNPFVEVELGTCQLTEKYQSYLDYMNTRIEIFLPFIGFEQISIDYMNSILSLKYNVDILSGNCVAILSATSFNSNLNSVVGQWNGNMAYSIPLSGRDFSQMASSLWNTATSAASVIASSKIPTIAPSGFSKGGGGGFGLPSLSSVANLGNNIINTIEAANATTSGGHLSANSGHLSMLTPYLIITRPVQKINANYYASFGRTLDAYTPFSALSGYTKVKSCNLSIPSATQDEILAIDKLLKEGVIF